jgi:hypothetical protein
VILDVAVVTAAPGAARPAIRPFPQPLRRHSPFISPALSRPASRFGR